MLSKKISILLTNDDGVHAPGLKRIAKMLKGHADITVVAPAEEQSGVGLSSTWRAPIHIDKVFWDTDDEAVWSVRGTPSDCVKMALSVILEKRPDMIISGINRGGNLGRGILYSGTVAAAIESTIQGIPAIAISCYDYHVFPDYEGTARHCLPIIDYLLKNPLPSGTFLNVNFPEKAHGDVKGIKLTRQGSHWWAEAPEKRVHPSEGSTYYWLGNALRTLEEPEKTETYWLEKGYAAAVPVHIGDLTDLEHLRKHAAAFNKIL